MVSSSVLPSVRVAVTVIEYSVPSSRPRSVDIVPLVISVIMPESVKQPSLVFE